jgi:hypothetical protein
MRNVAIHKRLIELSERSARLARLSAQLMERSLRLRQRVTEISRAHASQDSVVEAA